MIGFPRLAVRAVIVQQEKLLLVNAWPNQKNPLLCAPGGGVEPGQSLPDNLIREVHEETGLTVNVGAPCLVNEFHDPDGDFHQVDIYFRCQITAGQVDARWQDPEGVVHSRYWVTQEQMATRQVKPDSLIDIAWADHSALSYDPLEPIVR